MLIIPEIIKRYSELGFHQTGSLANDKAFELIENYLKVIGFDKCFKQPFGYNKFEYKLNYEMQLDLTVLHYCFLGKKTVSNPHFAKLILDLEDNQIFDYIAFAVCEAKNQGKDSLLLETVSPTMELCGVNSVSTLALDLPVFLISNKEMKKVKLRDFNLQLIAKNVFSQVNNLCVKSGNEIDAKRLLITTPLSGWYNCSNERGSGIAIALKLYEYFYKRINIDVIFTNGHELGQLGGWHASDCYRREELKAIIHLKNQSLI